MTETTTIDETRDGGLVPSEHPFEQTEDVLTRISTSTETNAVREVTD
jgi:hypothetical protein